MKKIILASTSPYRKEQLERLNIDFVAVSPKVDEQPLKMTERDHTELSRALSLLKARKVSVNHPQAIVIGGDQVASFRDGVLDKPGTKEKAFQQLKLLAGKEHRLITSLALIVNDQRYLHTCVATMKMRQLTDDQINRYIDIDEPVKCCGSYRLEALGISLFEKIDCEDYTSIIGIPLMWAANKLTELGLSVP